MIGLDTNILVRYLTQDDAKQAQLVNVFMQKHSKTEIMFINNVVICELIWVLERGYKYEKAQIIDIIKVILSIETFSFEQSDVLWMTLDVFEKSNIDFSDALVGELNKLHACVTTYTFDIKASKISSFSLL